MTAFSPFLRESAPHSLLPTSSRPFASSVTFLKIVASLTTEVSRARAPCSVNGVAVHCLILLLASMATGYYEYDPYTKPNVTKHYRETLECCSLHILLREAVVNDIAWYWWNSTMKRWPCVGDIAVGIVCLVKYAWYAWYCWNSTAKQRPCWRCDAPGCWEWVA